MSEVLEVVVAASQAGQRLDRCLRQYLPQLSRVALHELIELGPVFVNGRPARKGDVLRAGDRIRAEVPADLAAIDPDLPLEVLYEDAALVAIDKPAGVPSHSLRAEERGTVSAALLASYPEMRDVGHGALQAGLIHRLDVETSGVLIAARTRASFRRLNELQREGRLVKEYVALCQGHAITGTTRAYLLADRRRVRVASEPGRAGRAIETELIESTAHGAFSLVRVRVHRAGRHQVRAQLAALGHPIAGDSLYGGPMLRELSRHFLHAAAVDLPHPEHGRQIELRAQLPADLRAVLGKLAAG